MYAPLHVSSGFHLFLRSMGKRFPSDGDCRDGKTFETSAEKSLPTVCFLLSSSFVISFLSTTDSSSLHVFSLLSQPHIFLFHLNYLLLLVAPSTSRSPRPPPPNLFTFCSCQIGSPAGRWHSGRWPVAPPSSWRGWRTSWCRCRTPSSCRSLEGRSHSRPRGRCSWSGGTPPARTGGRGGWFSQQTESFTPAMVFLLTCRYFISGRPEGTRVSRLLSRWSSLSLGR